MTPTAHSLLAACALAAMPLHPAHATTPDLKDAARKLHAQSNAAIVGVRGLLEIDITMNGQPAGNQEVPVWGNATTIAPQLAVTAYQTLVPDVAAQAQRGALPDGVEINTRLNEIKFVDASGEEFDAKLILHDEDLDLAFLALDPRADNAPAWQPAPVDISSDPPVQLLDDVISMSRQPAALRFTSALATGTIGSVVERPRTLYAVDGVNPGAPAFNADGTFLGIVTLRTSPDQKQQAVPVILPAKYLRKLVPQATARQAELADTPASPDPPASDQQGARPEDPAPAQEPPHESPPGNPAPAQPGAATPE